MTRPCLICPNPIPSSYKYLTCRKCRGIPDMKANYEQRKLGKFVGERVGKEVLRT